MYSLNHYNKNILQNAEPVNCVVFVSELNQAIKTLAHYTLDIKYSYPFISAFGAVVSVQNLQRLSGLQCVKAIGVSSTVYTCDVPNADCSRSHSILFPQLQNLHRNKIDGRGIGMAIIDTGVSPHLDFIMPSNRLEFVDFVDSQINPYDDNGHGTAVAGIMCGNGLVSGSCLQGIAPRANLYALKAVGAKGEGNTFQILQAMQWVFEHHKEKNIKVLNLSFGTDPIGVTSDPLRLGAEALIKCGITVVASAGNSGPGKSTIKSPGTSPSVITVGGAAYSESGWGVAEFSSRGPAGEYSKPDILAPSVNVLTTGSQTHYTEFSGTSMASPQIAGVCALILQAYPAYSPQKVKEVLLSGTLKLDCTANNCGRGFLNLDMF